MFLFFGAPRRINLSPVVRGFLESFSVSPRNPFCISTGRRCEFAVRSAALPEGLISPRGVSETHSMKALLLVMALRIPILSLPLKATVTVSLICGAKSGCDMMCW